MKLSNKQKKRIANCIILTITGNSIVYMNNYLTIKLKLKKKMLIKRRALNNFDLTNFTYTIHCLYMLFIPFYPKKIKKKDTNDLKNRTKDNLNKKLINIQKYIYQNKYSTIKFKDNPIIEFSNKNTYIKRTPSIYLSKKKNSIPNDLIYLSGITIGIVFNDPATFYIRDNYIIQVLTNSDDKTNIHIKNGYLSLILISTLIAYIIHNPNIIEALILTNTYFQKFIYLKQNYKYEKQMKNEFNRYIQKYINIKKNNINKISDLYFLNKQPDTPLGDILVAITSVLYCNNSWDNVVYWSGFTPNGGIFICSLACALYALSNSHKVIDKIPKEQYLNIENYKLHIKFIKKLLQHL